MGVKNRYIGYGDGAACTVESLVLQHVSQEEEGNWAGWHCEGSPVRALWSLLMWDVIFMDVPDVFQVWNVTILPTGFVSTGFCPGILFWLICKRRGLYTGGHWLKYSHEIWHSC